MIPLSNNHFSVDDQIKDVVNYVFRNGPDDITAGFLREFPEWETLVWSDSWVDTETSDVDPDYTSWVADWLEDHTEVVWLEGEPFELEDGEDVSSW